MRMMKRFLMISSASLLLGAVGVSCAVNDDAEPSAPNAMQPSAELAAFGSPGSEEDGARFWFVEMQSPPISAGGDLNTVRNEKIQFRAEAARQGIQFTERLSFEDLWNGLSLEISPSERAKLSKLQSVKRIFPVVEVKPELTTAINMTAANIVQNTLGYRGKGIKVGIIDSGIDYHNQELGGCFGPGCKVAYGWDFVGDAFNSTNPIQIQDADPDDCGGHGSHVAGIVSADRTLKGVAPKATLGAYRVFGCSGSTLSDVMIQAMDKAKLDGMQVVNMSIGSAYAGWKEYPTAVAADNLVNSGVIVVCSAGNSGTGGLYATGAPGLGEHVISTAMFDNTHIKLLYGQLSDSSIAGYTGATGSPTAPSSGSGNIIKLGTPATTNDACTVNPPPPGYFTGKIALIRRGTCSFYEKSINAQNAGAIAVVLYNNVAGRINPTVAPTGNNPPVTIPVISISDTEGVAINNLIDLGPTTWTWTGQLNSFSNPSANLINGDSSYGLAATLDMKPDLGAPGGYIYSTVPLEQGGFATFSGTSMASPHTAGAVALLLQARPGTTAAQARAFLQNTAQPQLWSANPGSGALDMVHRQGAGMINIQKAIESKAIVTPSKLPLGESQPGPALKTLTVQNLSANPITYNISHTGAISTTGGTTFAPTNGNSGQASVSFSTTTLVVPANSSATFDATITANAALANKGLYGGYIVLNGGADGTLRVPYVGFKGDYQSIVSMTPTSNNFPWLAKLNGTSYTFQQSGAVYTLANGDMPYVLAHFDHPIRKIRIKAISRQGVDWGTAYEQEFIGRNSTSTGFYAFPWDGTVMQNGQLVIAPDNQYYFKVEVLKALGDEGNPAHWEIWSSGYMAIVRP